MHHSSLENMKKCVDLFLGDAFFTGSRWPRIVDVGSSDVNGGYRVLFPADRIDYIGLDLEAGPGVDLVLDDPYRYPLEDGTADVVISGQMLEHCEFFWLAFQEMVRVLSPTGYIFLIAPSAGAIHRYPVDCYRYYPDAFQALAKYANVHAVEIWRDERGPWRDLVGVFSKDPAARYRPRLPRRPELFNVAPEFDLDPAGTVRGSTPYLEVLRRLHSHMRPRRYLEIGVRRGQSFRLARCERVAVDPDPDPAADLGSSPATLHRVTSDEFFGLPESRRFSPDLAFIDGMHRFEYALRDFMNIEAVSRPGTVIVIDDIFPNLPEQALRDRRTRVWTGDVWKLMACLREHRKDLVLLPLDTSPTGLLLILGTNTKNRVLWSSYNPILRKYLLDHDGSVPEEILARRGALDPEMPGLVELFEKVAEARDAPDAGAQILAAARMLAASGVVGVGKRLDTADSDISRAYRRPGAAAAAGRKQPRLSVVVVTHNMARELPRTLRSLTPPLQKGVNIADYEILVVDNHSTRPADRGACEAIATNIRFLDQAEPTASPARAANLGLGEARSDLVGLFIDGARLASPRILATALDAAALGLRTVIATPGFHLGPGPQRDTIPHGYDAAAEDALLRDATWEEDPYRLFPISSFGVSARQGWFRPFSESNGLFMDKALWSELGGLDERFESAGGGYVNLDLFERAVGLPDVRVIVLLGEGTFHQIHGGAATNATAPRTEEFREEYARIRGRPWQMPEFQRSYVGSPPAEAMWSIEASARTAIRRERPLRRRHLGAQYEVDAPDSVLSAVQAGALKMRYRGRRFLKSAFDIALYTRLLAEKRPGTIVEIGTNEGGSGLWFADMMRANGIPPNVIGVDRAPPRADGVPGVRFVEGDAMDLGPVFSGAEDWPRPWLVIEDSAHTFEATFAVLTHFHPLLRAGDYMVVEDGIVSFLAEAAYFRYRDGPIRAVRDFLACHGDHYENDRDFADFFGRNVTWSPGGWLRRLPG